MTSPSEPAILKNPADIRARIQEAAGLSLDRLPMLQLIFDRLATACGDGLKHLASSSILYALGTTIFGGTTQFVVAWLIERTGSAMVPAWYMLATTIAAIVGVVGLMPHPELARERALSEAST